LGTPSVNIAVSSNVAALHSDMQEAASVVRSATDQMSQAGRQAQNAWSQLASATVEANSAQKAVKDTLRAIATGEVPLTTRVVNDLAVAQAEAAQAAKAHAAAQRELKSAMGDSTTAMASGYSQATLFSNVLGLRLGRGMEQIISRTPALSSAMSAIFPMVTAVAFLQLAEHIGDAISKWIANTYIFTKAMQDAYDAELVFNKKMADEAGKQKQYQQEIFNQTHSMSQIKQRDLDDEKSHLDAIRAALAANKTAQAETAKRGAQEAATPGVIQTEAGSMGVPGVVSEQTVAQMEKLRTEATLLNQELTTSQLRVQDFANMTKAAADAEAETRKRAADAAEAELQKRIRLQQEMKQAGLGAMVSSMPGGDVTAQYKQTLPEFLALVQRAKEGIIKAAADEQKSKYEMQEKYWANENKKMEKAARDAKEAREEADLSLKGKRDESLGQVDYKETQVKGQQSLGMIDDGQALSKLRALHAEQLALERAYIQAKIEIDKTDTKAYLKDIDEQAKIEAKGRKQALQDDIANLQQRMQAYRQWMTQVSQSMFSGINSWMQHQKTFGQAMKQQWNTIAMDSIRAIEQVAERWILTHVLMKAASALFHAFDVGGHLSAAAAKLGIDTSSLAAQKTAQGAATLTTSMSNMLAAASYAAVAAAAALAATSAIPIIGPAMAPGAAAETYAQGMVWAGMAAFDIGGVVPKTQVAMVHGGERVLTPSQNTNFERMVDQSTSNSGGDVHYHDNRKVSALDGVSTGRVMRKNSKQMVKELSRAMRMGKLGGM